ncbi:MAG TPA: hypothetical protein PLJ84_06680 [Bacteroidales bacterium]|nr:hypothetical protein [Bacteroidales bacterium]HPT02266.1 hypothetical protein [Bacteroidales bacterium]
MSNKPAKKRVIVSYQNLSSELKEAVLKKYPLGWVNNMIKVKGAGDTFFHAITLDTDEISYLIKVPVRIDQKSDKDDEDFFAESIDIKESDESSGGEGKEDDNEQDREE